MRRDRRTRIARIEAQVPGTEAPRIDPRRLSDDELRALLRARGTGGVVSTAAFGRLRA